MQYWRCKCGKRTAFGSDHPYACDTCSDCGSTLASHPDYHQEPIKHDYRPIYNRYSGEMEYEECTTCYKRHMIGEK